MTFTTILDIRPGMPAHQPNAPHPTMGNRAVSSFPIDCLPTPIRHYVEEGSVAVGVPPEMIALPLLVATGAAIGRYRCLRLKKGYEVLPVLFAAVVAPPGSGKTPALSTALEPLWHLQREADARHRQQLQQFGPVVPNGAASSPPTLDHLLTSDTTMEAIAPMLVSSPGLLVHFDELLAWVRSCNQYRAGRGADRQHWLSLWSCSQVKVDRKLADPIYMPRPAVAVLGGIQPDLLSELHDREGGRDGFVERILWIFPDATPAPWTTESIADATSQDVISLFTTLRHPPPDEPYVVNLTPAALEVWADWYNTNQAAVLTLEGLRAGFAAKLPIQVARLALILHALGDPHYGHPTLADATLARAIALGAYFQEQFELVLPRIMGKSRLPAKTLSSTILACLADGVPRTRTEIHRALSGNVKAEDLSQILNEFAAEGTVIRRVEASTGGRPAETWQLVASEPDMSWLEDGDPDERVF